MPFPTIVQATEAGNFHARPLAAFCSLLPDGSLTHLPSPTALTPPCCVFIMILQHSTLLLQLSWFCICFPTTRWLLQAHISRGRVWLGKCRRRWPELWAGPVTPTHLLPRSPPIPNPQKGTKPDLCLLPPSLGPSSLLLLAQVCLCEGWEQKPTGEGACYFCRQRYA